MNSQGETRRSRRFRTGAIVLGALAFAAVGLTIGCGGTSSDSESSASELAGAEIPTAPKNTMGAGVPVYKATRVHTVHFDITE